MRRSIYAIEANTDRNVATSMNGMYMWFSASTVDLPKTFTYKRHNKTKNTMSLEGYRVATFLNG